MKSISKDLLKGLLLAALLMVLIAGCNMGMLEPEAEAEERTSISESMYYPLYMLSNWWGWGEYTQASYLSPGTVIVVQPGTSWSIDRGTTAENMVRNNQVRTIVMAGVGSSSRGTAALAKLVANEIGQPVAGIVTGWGDYTTATEGMEGYFTGREHNQSGTYYNNTASAKMVSLLSNGARPTRIIGHSKGAMDTANALFRLNQLGRSNTYSQATYITFGMGVFVPPGLNNFRQYIGSADSLGSTNTVNTNPMITVSGRGHSLSPAMSMHVPVTGRLGL